MAALRRFSQNITTLYQEHEHLWQLVLLFAVFRAMVSAIMGSGGLLMPHAPDIPFYFDFSRLSGGGIYPFIDFWMEYPPVFPWLAVAAYRLSFHLVPQFGVDLMPVFNLFLRWEFLPFDIGTLMLVYAIVMRLRGKDAGLWAAVVYSLLFAPLYIFMGWFDSVAAFFLLLAIYGVVSKRPVIAGLGMGFGFGVKLFPIVVMPAAVRVFRKRRLWVMLGVTVLSVAVVFVPFLVLSPQMTLAFFSTLSGRVSWQSVWALLEGYRSYGIVAPLGLRGDPVMAAAWVPEGVSNTLPWLLITVIVGALGLYLWTRRIDWQNPVASSAFAGLTFGILILYSKGYSPQWAIYFTALSIVLIPGMRGLLYGILWGIILILEWPLAFVIFGSAEVFLVGVILARTVLMLAFTLECLVRALPAAGWMQHVRRWSLPAAAAIGAVIMAAVLPASLNARSGAVGSEGTALPFVELKQSVDPAGTEPVLTDDPAVIEWYAPYLPGQPFELLPNIDGEPWVEPDAWLAENAAPGQVVWLVRRDATGEDTSPLYGQMQNWLDAHGCLINGTWLGLAQADRYFIGEVGAAQPVDAKLGGQVVLTEAALPVGPARAGEGLCVALNWQRGVSVQDDARYAVFVHVVAPDGSLAAQGDRWFGPQPAEWSQDAVAEEQYGVMLPADLPAGDYTLMAGVYNVDSGERLTLPGGADMVELGAVEVVR